MSGGALELLEAAHRLGLWVDDRRRFAPGRKVFPRYVDRVHICAVLAPCGRACARAEALCKTAVLRQIDGRRGPLDPELCWPPDSAETLARHVRRILIMKRKATAKAETEKRATGEKPKPGRRKVASGSKSKIRRG